MSIVEQLTQAIEQKFAEPEQSRFFLLEVQHLPKDVIQVFIDSDTGVLVDECAALSRHLENLIETNGWLSENYTIEVSSAGVGNPLKVKRQYVKNIGRKVNVERTDAQKHTEGMLVEANDEFIVVEWDEKVKIEGTKKKERVTLRQEIPYDKIKKAVTKVSFR